MATLILRPDGAGNDALWDIGGGSPEETNWESVDEVSNDDDVTYVSTESILEFDDTYNIGTNALLTGATINSVTVYASAKYVGSGSGSVTAPVIWQLVRVGSTTYASGTSDILTASYADTSNAWTTNPADSQAWEKADIDDLQIGIRAKMTTGGVSGQRIPFCTQVWAVVDYTAGDIESVSTVTWANTESVAGVAKADIQSVATIDGQ